MYFKQLAKNVISVIAILFLWGCGSSAEYTTAKMAIQDEEWEKAEEFLFKALEVEPANAEVMVQIGYHVHAKKEQWLEMSSSEIEKLPNLTNNWYKKNIKKILEKQETFINTYKQGN